MQLSAFVILACVLAAAARPISSGISKVDTPVTNGLNPIPGSEERGLNENIVGTVNNIVADTEHGERGRALKRTGKVPRRRRSGSSGSSGSDAHPQGIVGNIANGVATGVNEARKYANGVVQFLGTGADEAAGAFTNFFEDAGAGLGDKKLGDVLAHDISDIGNAAIKIGLSGKNKRLTRRRGDVGARQNRRGSNTPSDTYLSDAEDSDDGKVGVVAGQRKRLTRRRGEAGTRRARSLSLSGVEGSAAELSQSVTANTVQAAESGGDIAQAYANNEVSDAGNYAQNQVSDAESVVSGEE